MSGPGALDVRIPIGGMFTVVGTLLVLYGFATRGDSALYARSLSLNMNLWWGGAMLAFGLALLLLARGARRG